MSVARQRCDVKTKKRAHCSREERHQGRRVTISSVTCCTSTEENRMMRSNILTLAILFAIFVVPLRGEVN